MYKAIQKIISMILICSLTLSLSIPVLAKDTVEQIESVPDAVKGLDKYISRFEDGTLCLDIESAQMAGYTETITTAISSHLEGINQLVRQGEAITDECLNIYIFSGSLTRAGVRKVVTYWWGQTDYYLTSTDAKDIYTALDNAGNSLIKLYDEMNNLDNVAQQALAAIAGLGVLAFAYSSQVKLVSNYGSQGIIEQCVLNYDTGVNTITFHPQ